MREWTQKHIEELIKDWWDNHKDELSGGGGSGGGGGGDSTHLNFDPYICSNTDGTGDSPSVSWATVSVYGNVQLTSQIYDPPKTGSLVSTWGGPYLFNRLIIANYVTSADFIDGNGICYIPATGLDNTWHVDAQLYNAKGKPIFRDIFPVKKHVRLTSTLAFGQRDLGIDVSGVWINGTHYPNITFWLDSNTRLNYSDPMGNSLASSDFGYLLRISDPSPLIGEISPLVEWRSVGITYTATPII